MNTFASSPANTLKSRVKTAFVLLSDVVASFIAATAAANAIENHRQPAAADLRRLGLEGVTFKVSG